MIDVKLELDSMDSSLLGEKFQPTFLWMTGSKQPFPGERSYIGAMDETKYEAPRLLFFLS